MAGKNLLWLAPALLMGGSLAAAVVASVGAEKIDEVELSAKLAAEERGAGRALSSEEKSGVLQALVNQRLLVSKARADGLAKRDDLRRTVDDYERQLLANLIYEKEVAGKATVSEQEARAFFDKNPQLFELRKVSQILVQPLNTEKVEAARTEAARLKAKVAAAPGSFAETAKAESDDPVSKEKGGELGEIRRGMMLKELEEAVFSAKPGAIAGPVRTQFGFHILQVKSSRKQGWDEAKEVISREIVRARSSELQQKLLEELAKKYKVKVNSSK